MGRCALFAGRAVRHDRASAETACEIALQHGADLDRRRILREPVLGGLINEYARAA